MCREPYRKFEDKPADKMFECLNCWKHYATSKKQAEDCYRIIAQGRRNGCHFQLIEKFNKHELVPVEMAATLRANAALSSGPDRLDAALTMIPCRAARTEAAGEPQGKA